jgi:hypothetical protein
VLKIIKQMTVLLVGRRLLKYTTLLLVGRTQLLNLDVRVILCHPEHGMEEQSLD